MPVVGRKPKPDGQKRNRVKPTYEWVEVEDVPFKGGPKLPRYRLGQKPWPALTKSWWSAVSSMPHCALWSTSDWQFAIETALVAAEFHDGDVRVATELRNRQRVLGTTFDYRRDLRIRYVDEVSTSEVSSASVTGLAEYRAQLNGA